MVGYANCPHCELETQVEFEEHNEGEDIEDTCEHCDRKFIYHFESDVNIYAEKVEQSQTKPNVEKEKCEQFNKGWGRSYAFGDKIENEIKKSQIKPIVNGGEEDEL